MSHIQITGVNLICRAELRSNRCFKDPGILLLSESASQSGGLVCILQVIVITELPSHVLKMQCSCKHRHRHKYIPRAPQCLSPRWNWDTPPPLPQARVYPPFPPYQKGGTRSPGVRGRGSPNSDDWRKSLALCLLCGLRVYDSRTLLGPRSTDPGFKPRGLETTRYSAGF